MKKITTILLLLIIFIPCRCNAQSLEDKIDTNTVNSYLSDLGYSNFEFNKIINLIVDGNYSGLIKYIFDTMNSTLKITNVYDNKFMLTIIGICIISVIMNLFSDDKDVAFSEKIIVCMIAFLFFELYSELYYIAKSTIDSITGFMQVSMPVYFGISSVFSEKLPYGIYSFLLLFVNFFQYMAVNIIFPGITALIMLTTVTSVCPEFDTGSIKKLVRSAIHWILGLYTTIFIIGMKITQTLVYGTQRIFLSGIKYIVSHGVPVVGSFLSDTAETLINSVILLHNSFGIAGILLILFLVFAPAVVILFYAVALSITGSIFYTISKSSVFNYVTTVSAYLVELVAVLLCTSVTFVIVIATEISALG